MKRSAKLISAILALCTAFLMPFSAYAFTTKSIFTSSTYTHQDRFSDYTLEQGIDVSTHNVNKYDANNNQVYNIDWAKIKAAGVDFSIARVGCRGYASSGTLLKDNMLEKNVNLAHEQGLDVGVYFYSQAITTAEAKEEAEFVIKYIKNLKDKINLPVYYDYEFSGVSSGRLDKAWNNGTLNKTKMTANAKAFCSTIENAGYKAGIYASKSFFEDQLNYKELDDKYDIWLAHYATSTKYAGDFSIWQFSSKGTVKGINGYVDSNFKYNPKTFDTITIPDQAYTGNMLDPDFEVKYKGELLKPGKHFYVTYSNNTDYGKANVTVTGVNEYTGIKSYAHFNIVPSAVDNTQMQSRTATTVSVKWAQHADIDGYQIKYKPAGAKTWSNAGETSELSYPVKSLKSATKYNFKIRAYKTVNTKKLYGIFGQTITVSTSPAKVSGIKTAARTNNSLTLQWTAQPNATKYTVYMFNNETQEYEQYTEISGGSHNTLTLTSLTALTPYKFKIRACKEDVTKGMFLNGALSNEYTAYTSTKTPKLKSAVAKSNKRITAKWSKRAGAAGYQVMWSTSKSFSSNKKTVTVRGKGSTTIAAAKAKKRYYVRVRTYANVDGATVYSPWSNVISVVTK